MELRKTAELEWHRRQETQEKCQYRHDHKGLVF